MIAEKKKKKVVGATAVRRKKGSGEKNYLDNAHQHVKGKEPIKERPKNGRLGDSIKEVIEKGSEGRFVEDLRQDVKDDMEQPEKGDHHPDDSKQKLEILKDDVSTLLLIRLIQVAVVLLKEQEGLLEFLLVLFDLTQRLLLSLGKFLGL